MVRSLSMVDVCSKIVLIWADNPHINEVADNQIYLILDGKAFQYMQNRSPSLKSKLHENDEYVMIRKLVSNDFFIQYSPPRKYSAQQSSKKYQLMVDQQTLLGKISGDIFKKIFLPPIQERWKRILGFSKKVAILNTLPSLMIYELSKYMKEVTYSRGSSIIMREQKSPYVYFIESGEIEYKSFNSKSSKQTPNKNYLTSYTKGFHRQILKENDVFGIDTFSPITYEELQSQNSAESKTNSLLFRIDKRILAIVISSFQEIFNHPHKIYSSINLNDQILGQGYRTSDMEALTRNAESIKTSQKKIRDIKLRYLNTSKKSRTAGKFFDDPVDSQGLGDIKYDSCHSLTKIKVNKGQGLKFSQTFHSKSRPSFQQTFNRNNVSPFQGSSKMSHVLMSAYNQGNIGDILAQQSEPNEPSQLFTPRKTVSAFNIKRKSLVVSHGKEEGDIIRSYLQKKLRGQMLRKAELILQRNTNKKIKEKQQVKRLFNNKNIRSKTNEKNRKQKKTVGQELYERMNRLNDNPLLSLIQSQRKKLEYNIKILQRKSKEKKKEQVQSKKGHALILISND